jgi:hypothetical protein
MILCGATPTNKRTRQRSPIVNRIIRQAARWAALAPEPQALSSHPKGVSVPLLSLSVPLPLRRQIPASAVSTRRPGGKKTSTVDMASLSDTLIKGGVGAFGFLASAYTLTKFIVSTPVVRSPPTSAACRLRGRSLTLLCLPMC